MFPISIWSVNDSYAEFSLPMSACPKLKSELSVLFILQWAVSQDTDTKFRIRKGDLLRRAAQKQAIMNSNILIVDDAGGMRDQAAVAKNSVVSVFW